MFERADEWRRRFSSGLGYRVFADFYPLGRRPEGDGMVKCRPGNG